jgi:hypothetical protein
MLGGMSENYKLYAQKQAESRAVRLASGPLHYQLMDLLRFVRECESAWSGLR